MICHNEPPEALLSPSPPALPNGPEDTLTPERIFTEHAPRIYRLVRLLLGNEADAEDVTQQVFLQVLRKLPSFRGESAFSTWLNRVAVNEALIFRRRRGARRHHEVCEVLEEFAEDGRHPGTAQRWASPLTQLIDRETHERIEQAIAHLPELYRDVFVLADVEGLPNPEIGELLGLGVPAVKSRLHRARLLMRKALAPYFEEQAA